MTLSKNILDAIAELLQETDFAIWNAAGSHRLKASYSDEGFVIARYDDLLHPVKAYATLRGALAYLQKMDDESLF